MKIVKKVLNKKLIATVCMIAILCVSSSLTAYADTTREEIIGGARCTITKKTDGGISASAYGDLKQAKFTIATTYYISGSSIPMTHTTTYVSNQGYYNYVSLTKAQAVGLYESYPNLASIHISHVTVTFDLNVKISGGTQLVTGSFYVT